MVYYFEIGLRSGEIFLNCLLCFSLIFFLFIMYFDNKKYIKIFEFLWFFFVCDDLNERYFMNESDILVGILLLFYYFFMVFYCI